MKLIVLERLAGLKKHHAKVLQEVLMDILRALSSPNVDICRKTLEVAMDLVTPRNIEEVVQVRQAEVVAASVVLSSRAGGVFPQHLLDSGGGQAGLFSSFCSPACYVHLCLLACFC